MVNIGFISLGCSKNLVDTENMIGILAEKGYEVTGNIDEADVIIVNTCAFIESAKSESIETILEAAKYKSGRCKALVCAGCLSERYRKEVLDELPEVDAVIGVNDFSLIAEVIENVLNGKKDMRFDGNSAEVEGLPRVLTTPGYTAYLKIAEGCDNFCSYCAIPYIRGRYRSRKMEDIVDEAMRLAESGVKELIVIAQDTSRYGVDIYKEKKLSELLKRLCTIDEIRWVRVHYCYPEQITDDMIETFVSEEKIVKYMDIPIQHCNDTILKRMNRKTTGENIRNLIKKLREAMPDIILRTSLIAGFPGETEEQYVELCSFIKEMRFDRLGVFAFSPEEGTPAYKMDGQLDEEVKEKRAESLMEVQKEIAEELCREKIGKTLTVLTEGFDEESCLYYGRSYGDSLDVDPKVYFASEDELEAGKFVEVKIIDFCEYDLTGVVVDE